jgi:hypothetical protein
MMMGTRADFYVGTGKEAEWLGSVAFDGYEWAEGLPNEIASAKTGEDFRDLVAAMLASRDDATTPAQGWPWPWKTSRLTDYVYYFDGEKVRWEDREDWPEMDTDKAAVPGELKSGIMAFVFRPT